MTDPAGHEDEILSVTTTVAAQEDARRLAGLALAQRLAACAQVEPGLESHYRWEGRLHADPEVRLTFKTVPAAWPALQTFLAKHHPYELPQVLGQVLRASPAYAAWVRAQVAAPAGSVGVSVPAGAAPSRPA